EFADLTASVAITGQQAVISSLEGSVFEGSLKGNATVKWGGGISADGQFDLKGANVTQVLATFTTGFTTTGTLETSMKFASQGQKLSELFGAPRVTATFTLLKGIINNVDLVRAIQTPSRSAQRGGKTQFTEIAGEALSAGNRIAYRNLRLSSGPLNANGSI